jgi:hypothetical protein
MLNGYGRQIRKSGGVPTYGRFMNAAMSVPGRLPAPFW